VTRERNAACLAAHLQAERGHDIDATLAGLHPECVFVDQPLGLRLEGPAGARQHYELWWDGFGATPENGMLHYDLHGLLRQVGHPSFDPVVSVR
jgi:ketosteroid isomerase-like protein